MGYPAFHTRLMQGAQWARELQREGKLLAVDFLCFIQTFVKTTVEGFSLSVQQYCLRKAHISKAVDSKLPFSVATLNEFFSFLLYLISAELFCFFC